MKHGKWVSLFFAIACAGMVIWFSVAPWEWDAIRIILLVFNTITCIMNFGSFLSNIQPEPPKNDNR